MGSSISNLGLTMCSALLPGDGRSPPWPCLPLHERFKRSSAPPATHTDLNTTHPLAVFAVDVRLMRLAHSGGCRLITDPVRQLQSCRVCRETEREGSVLCPSRLSLSRTNRLCRLFRDSCCDETIEHCVRRKGEVGISSMFVFQISLVASTILNSSVRYHVCIAFRWHFLTACFTAYVIQ